MNTQNEGKEQDSMIKSGKLKFYLLTVDAIGKFSFLQEKKSLCDRTTYTHIVGDLSGLAGLLVSFSAGNIIKISLKLLFPCGTGTANIAPKSGVINLFSPESVVNYVFTLNFY